MSNKLETGFEKGDSRNLPRVDMFMVYEFISADDRFNAPEVRGAKANASSRETYGDTAIGYVCLKREQNTCILKAKICPEHKVRNKSYSVEAIIDEQKNIIHDVNCLDCPAAEGGCKHAFAFLMWLHRRSEEPSITEVTCYWKKSVLSGVGTQLKFILASDMCESCSSDNINVSLPETATFLSDVLNKIKEFQVDCQMSKYSVDLDRREVYKLSIHQCFFSFSQHKQKTSEEFITFMKKEINPTLCNIAEEKTRQQSDCLLWHELRYGRITASKLYESAMCKTSEGSLVKQILGAAKVYDSLSMKRGKNLEKLVFEELKTDGFKIDLCGFVIIESNPIFGASPDGVGEDFILEIKCPTSEKTFKNYVDNEKIHKKFEAQMNLQMLALKKKKGLFCVAHWNFEQNRKIYKYEIYFDEAFLTDLMNKATMFWKNNIYSIITALTEKKLKFHIIVRFNCKK